ncbi:hypothetical protein HUU42_16830 [bacterium]|nr:hypothetical protein [bacterium]
MKPSLNQTICPFCRANAGFVFVHGHYQCIHCKNVMVRCCEGEVLHETQRISKEPAKEVQQRFPDISIEATF